MSYCEQSPSLSTEWSLRDKAVPSQWLSCAETMRKTFHIQTLRMESQETGFLQSIRNLIFYAKSVCL